MKKIKKEDESMSEIPELDMIRATDLIKKEFPPLFDKNGFYLGKPNKKRKTKVKLNEDNLTIELIDNVEYFYAIDLETCNDDVKMLDCILHIREKDWCYPELLDKIIGAVEEWKKIVIKRKQEEKKEQELNSFIADCVVIAIKEIEKDKGALQYFIENPDRRIDFIKAVINEAYNQCIKKHE